MVPPHLALRKFVHTVVKLVTQSIHVARSMHFLLILEKVVLFSTFLHFNHMKKNMMLMTNEATEGLLLIPLPKINMINV